MFRICAIATTALFASTAALAQDDYARTGVYLGVAGTYAIDNFEDEVEAAFEAGFGSPVNLDLDNTAGVTGRVGFRFHPNVAAELEVEWLAGFEGDFSAPGLGKIATTDVEPLVFTGNVKGYLLTGRFQPFVLVGGGVMTAEVTFRDTLGLGVSFSDRFTDVAARFGGGIDVYATEHFAVSVEADYVLPFGDVDDLDYIPIGLGLQYRF